MLLLAMLAAGATPGSTAVVVTRRIGVAPAASVALSERVAEALSEAGITPVVGAADSSRQLAVLGVKDTAACLARKQCIIEFGRQLGADVVVSVALSEFEGEGSMTLEAWRVGTETLLLGENLSYRASADPRVSLTSFASRLHGLRAPKPDVPVTTTLVPPPRDDLPPPPPPAPERSHATSFVVGGVGVAALVAAGALGVSGLLAQQRLGATVTGAPDRSPLSASEARALADQANTQFTIAGIAGLAGLGLGTTAVLLW